MKYMVANVQWIIELEYADGWSLARCNSLAYVLLVMLSTATDTTTFPYVGYIHSFLIFNDNYIRTEYEHNDRKNCLLLFKKFIRLMISCLERSVVVGRLRA